MPDEQHTTNTRALLERVLAAYQEIALCEAWLMLDESRRAAARLRSQEAAAFAQERQRELGQEASDG
jgi:hypothetical protein